MAITHSWPDNQTNHNAEYSGKETKVYTVAVPNLAGTIPGTLTPKHMKETKKLLRYVKKLDGFLGLHPVPPHGTLLLFKTENQAKRARNLLENDLQINYIGDNITEVFIPEEYAKGGQT